MQNQISNGVTSLNSEHSDLKERNYELRGLINDHQLISKQERSLSFFGYRHLMTVLGFFTFAFSNGHRVATSVALVAMVNHTLVKVDTHLNTSLPQSCSYNLSTSNSYLSKSQDVFNWDSTKQGAILAVNFAGYMVTNIPAGRMAEIFGAKWTILYGNLGMVLFTFLSPISATWSPYALMMVQFVKGLSQGFCVSSAFVLMANWFPVSERSLLSSVTLNGHCVGSMVLGVLSGWICDRLGWPYVFYITGGMQGIFCTIFYFLYHEGPHCHPKISQEEREYIEQGKERDLSKKRSPVPWKRIFLSLPVFASLVGTFGYFWSLFHFVTVHPAFMKSVLQYTMTENGFLSSLPYIIMVLGCTLAGTLSNKVKDCVSVDTTRKTCNSVCSLGFCASLAGVVLAGCDRMINAVFFYLASFFVGIGLCGAMIVSVDMSPNFSGSLSGITASVASLASVILPVIAGAMTTNGTVEEWRHVFYIHVSVVLLTGLFFHAFGSAKLQEWNSEERHEGENSASKKESPSENNNPISS